MTQPAKNGTPQATHDAGTGYTAAITWSPADGTFGANKVYTASVVLTAADGYAFSNLRDWIFDLIDFELRQLAGR